MSLLEMWTVCPVELVIPGSIHLVISDISLQIIDLHCKADVAAIPRVLTHLAGPYTAQTAQ